MKTSVGIVDYGMGNLHSVAKAFALQGAAVCVSDQKRKLSAADILILPGVGSFGAAMTTLAKKQLDDFIREWLSENKPYVGICLGFQMLFEKSEESRGIPGLAALKGSVVKFRFSGSQTKKYDVPHMGWNSAQVKNPFAKKCLQGIGDKAYFYFVHSYYPQPEDQTVTGTTTEYGVRFCSSVAKANLFASQFHPEKSGINGLKLVKNILKGVTS